MSESSASQPQPQQVSRYARMQCHACIVCITPFSFFLLVQKQFHRIGCRIVVDVLEFPPGDVDLIDDVVVLVLEVQFSRIDFLQERIVPNLSPDPFHRVFPVRALLCVRVRPVVRQFDHRVADPCCPAEYVAVVGPVVVVPIFFGTIGTSRHRHHNSFMVASSSPQRNH